MPIRMGNAHTNGECPCHACWTTPYIYAGLQIEGVLAYFMQIKCQKRIGDKIKNIELRAERQLGHY
jgi:hypothetical protein